MTGRPTRIEAALERLHGRVRAGDLDGLDAAAAEIDAALAEAGTLDRATLERVGRLARRNAETLAAAARGVRAARQRLAEIRAIAGGFVAYDAEGRRDAAAGPAGRLVQRL